MELAGLQCFGLILRADVTEPHEGYEHRERDSILNRPKHHRSPLSVDFEEHTLALAHADRAAASCA
jgi:hypothetical protein